MIVTEEFLLSQRCAIDEDPAAFQELKRRHLTGNLLASSYYLVWLMTPIFGIEDRVTGMAILNSLVTKGLPRAYYLMAIYDPANEKYWIKRGYEAGSFEAIYRMAHYYYMADNTPMFLKLSIQAVNLGSLEAAESLVNYYYRKKDYYKALEYMEICLKYRHRNGLNLAYLLGYKWDQVPGFITLYNKYKHTYPSKYWKD